MDQVIFNWAVGVAGFFGGWLLKVIWDAIQDLKQDIKTMDSKMHQDFVRRDDFKDAMTHVQKDMDELKQDMKDGFKQVNNTLNMIFQKIDSKEDKE
jgi:hypothetical protein